MNQSLYNKSREDELPLNSVVFYENRSFGAALKVFIDVLLVLKHVRLTGQHGFRRHVVRVYVYKYHSFLGHSLGVLQNF